MLATLAGFLALLLGLSLLLLPLVVTELSRPRDSVWGAVVLLLGLVLVTSATRLTGAPMLAVLCGGLLVGRLGGEVAQGRWRALTDEERQALRSAERWNRSLNQLAATTGNLLQSGVGAAAGVSVWLAERRQGRSHGKRWVRAESSPEAAATAIAATASEAIASEAAASEAAASEAAGGAAGSAAQVTATPDPSGACAPEAAALNPDSVTPDVDGSAGGEIPSAVRVPPARELPESAAESAAELADADAAFDVEATAAQAPAAASAPAGVAAPPAAVPVNGSTLALAPRADLEPTPPEPRDSDRPAESAVTPDQPGAFAPATLDPGMVLSDSGAPVGRLELQPSAPEATAPTPAGDRPPRNGAAEALPGDHGVPVVADFDGIDALLAAAAGPEGLKPVTGPSAEVASPPSAPGPAV